MATYQYELQRAGGAYAGCVPERVWHRKSRHTTLLAAAQALRRALREMSQRCGYGSWDDHYRVVGLPDMTPIDCRDYGQD